MEYKETILDIFTVVGISVRTINKDSQSQKDIASLWERFMLEQIMASIPNRISDDIYCIYTDYESDFTGEYTTIIGCKVSSTNNLPQGLIIKQVPECKYRVYVSEGKIPDAIGQTWMNIWQEGERINRAYEADFDLYSKESFNPDHAIVETYLSVK